MIGLHKNTVHPLRGLNLPVRRQWIAVFGVAASVLAGCESNPPAAAPVAVTADDGANPFGGDSPEDTLMPDVVCMNLQDAQNEIQDHGVFLSRSRDASGEGRNQIVDSNWVVVSQSPPAGSPIGEGEAVLSVFKYGETSAC